MLEKVAMHHTKLLQPKAMSLKQTPFFHDATAEFVETLELGSNRIILASGEVVYQKGKASATRDLFCVARGVVRVVQANVDSKRLAASAGRQTRRQGIQDALLGEGAVFGENIALELKNTRAMSVVSETISDLYMIPGRCLCDALAQHPHEIQRFLDLLQERGFGVRFPEELTEIGRLSRFPLSFLERLKKICRAKASCGGAKFVEEGQKMSEVFFIFRGKVLASREYSDFPPIEIKAPSTVGCFAVNSPDERSETSMLVNSFCGYFAVDIQQLRDLLDEYPSARRSWDDLVEEEQQDLQPTTPSASGRRASRMLVFAQEDVALPDDEEEQFILDTLEKRFEGADGEFLDCLRDILEKRVFSEDEVILAQGDDGTFAILIASGCCTVEVNGTKVGEVQVDIITYASVITACEKIGQWQLALSALSEHKQRQLQTDLITYNSAISACEKGSQWEHALDLLRQVEISLKPDVITCSAAISACEKSDEWQRAIQLLTDMNIKRLQVNVITYSAVILACDKTAEWRQALQLLSEAVIRACGQAAVWQQSLQMLFELTTSNLEADLINYNSSISACGKAEEWQLWLEAVTA
eukprot:symbB.v1.2.034310.t2/scaffold4407.1/size40053/1